MATIRKLDTIYTPPAHAGFLGRGHSARPVIQKDFSYSDPFIMLMDDVLDKKDDEPVGGPHPHAGFETVTLVLEGQIGEGEHRLAAGDLEMMTAGKGVVHTETIAQKTKLRILQLWLNLPQEHRWAAPRLQRLQGDLVPRSIDNGVDIRVYSGDFAGVRSPIKNYTPIIISELKFEAATSTAQNLPPDFNVFLYVLSGSLEVGDDHQVLQAGQVGWLKRYAGADSTLHLKSGLDGAHVVLYGAQPQNHNIVSHGPFIADTMEEIRELYAQYRSGKIRHIWEVVEEEKQVL